MTGSLANLSPFDLYRQSFIERGTGSLRLQHSGTSHTVIFRNGSVVFARSSQDSARLGTVLLRAGLVSAGQLDDLVRSMQPGRRLGQMAVQKGYVTLESLHRCLRSHQCELAIAPLLWEEGSFEYHPGECSGYQDVYLEQSTADIIFEGVRRIAGLERIRDLLGCLETTIHFASDPLLRFQRVSLEPPEAYILSRIQGPTTIREICQVSALDEIPTLRALLGFLLTGIAESTDASTPAGVAGAMRPEACPRDSRPALQPDPELEAELIRRLKDMPGANPYQLLGVSPHATAGEIDQACYDLIRKYHPDSLAGRVTRGRLENAEELIRSITRAHRILKDPEQRSQCDRDLRAAIPAGTPAGGAPKREQPAQPPARAAAQRAFDDGRRLLNTGNEAAAQVKFREAVRIDENMPLYRYHLARCIAADSRRRREAEFHYQLAIHQAPWNPGFHKSLGELYEQCGLQERAQACFDRAAGLRKTQKPSVPGPRPPSQAALRATR